MIESYKQSIEEFKRVDHLFYVTLKYTRTVDVIRSMVDRLISTVEYGIDTILSCMKEEGELEDVPNNPVGKCELVQEIVDEGEVKEFLGLYLKWRKLMRARYNKREEYRRHVTMIVDYEGETLNVDIDLLKEYYDLTRKFLTYLKQRIEPYKDDEDN